MDRAEVEAHFHQAESELDRVRRQLERKRALFENVNDVSHPLHDQIVKETSKLLTQYHEAEAEAQLWADILERTK